MGEEIAQIIGDLDIGVHFTAEELNKQWYGEPADEDREEFMYRARLMNLDAMTHPTSSEPLTTRLWRRYGVNAMELLERIQEDPGSAELLIENAEYLRCEIELTARREMITKLEDFMRRRSKIEQVVRKEDVIAAPGLKHACDIFFGDEADARLKEYIDSIQGTAAGG